MPEFFDDYFESSNGRTQIRSRFCVPSQPPRAVIQISHGIAEHIERYDPFAAFLAEHGFFVAGNDHLGHGKSLSPDRSDLGFFGETGGWKLAVGDMRKLTELLREKYPSLPCFLFGHSMGSFLTRSYLICYRDGIQGAVLSGTAWQSQAAVAAGLALGKRECKKYGKRYRSQRLNDIAFGGYNKGFEPRRTICDCLSRDEAVVDRYQSDPLCGFIPTAGLFTDMMEGFAFNQKPSNLSRMKKSLPVLFLSGDRDPVGANGKGVIQSYTHFLNAGMQDVTLKLYHGGRHEMLNERNREQVFWDILHWFDAKLAHFKID